MRLKVHSRRYLLILATLLAIAVQPSVVADELAYLFGDSGATAVVVDERYAAAVAAALDDPRASAVHLVVGVGAGVPAALTAHPAYSGYDDLLATGGTVSAASKLIQQCGAQVDELAFVIELNFLNGRDRLNGHSVFSLIQY